MQLHGRDFRPDVLIRFEKFGSGRNICTLGAAAAGGLFPPHLSICFPYPARNNHTVEAAARDGSILSY